LTILISFFHPLSIIETNRDIPIFGAANKAIISFRIYSIMRAQKGASDFVLECQGLPKNRGAIRTNGWFFGNGLI